MTAYAHYLRDVVHSILDSARDAKADFKAKVTQSGTNSAEFEAGRALAYYEVSSMLIAQLTAFGIPLQELELPPDLDLERELL